MSMVYPKFTTSHSFSGSGDPKPPKNKHTGFVQIAHGLFIASRIPIEKRAPILSVLKWVSLVVNHDSKGEYPLISGRPPVLAGGYVRDLVRGQPPKDMDIWVCRQGGRFNTVEAVKGLSAIWGPPKSGWAVDAGEGAWREVPCRVKQVPGPPPGTPKILEHCLREVFKWTLPDGTDVDIIFHVQNPFPHIPLCQLFDIRACMAQVHLDPTTGAPIWLASSEFLKDIDRRRLVIMPGGRLDIKRSLKRAEKLKKAFAKQGEKDWTIGKVRDGMDRDASAVPRLRQQ